MSWFQSLLFGLVSGLSEFLPVSSEAHMILLGRLFGLEDPGSGMRLFAHLGALLALVTACMPEISRLSRENRIAAVPVRRRKRQPDTVCLLDWRVLKTSSFFLLIGFLTYPWIGDQGQRLWILGLGLVLNGVVLYAPQFLAGANKDARMISKLDAMLIGFSGALGVIPGVSRVAALSSGSLVRGCSRDYTLHLTLLLSLPALCILILLNFASILAFGITGFSFVMFLSMLTCCVMSFIGAFSAIQVMRFLSVKAGFASFAYYCWGCALFAFILYLAI